MCAQIFSLLLLLGAEVGSEEQTAEAARPNIVFILVDDLGYGDLSCYGNTDIATTNIDRLAEEGTRFTQFYVASPICSPSRVAFTTGQFPSRHGITGHFANRARNRERGMPDFLDPDAPSLARQLKQGGYATAHFGKWHMGGGRDVDDAPHPSAYGFDESLVSFEGLGDRILPKEDGLSRASRKLGQGKITDVNKREMTGFYVNRAIDFLQRKQSAPFYLQLWLNDVHDPFHPSPEERDAFSEFDDDPVVRDYYATLKNVDEQIGRLLDTLDTLGVADETLVLFASDNGPSAWRHYYDKGLTPPGVTGGLRGRKWSLYEGGIRVPFVVRWPGRVAPGVTDERSIVSAVDLVPTLCRLAQVPLPNATLDGTDLGVGFQGGAGRERMLFWDYGRSPLHIQPGLESDQSPPLAVRDGQWKFLMQPGGQRMELYDLQRDPAESTNLANTAPKTKENMKNMLTDWFRALPEHAPDPGNSGDE